MLFEIKRFPCYHEYVRPCYQRIGSTLLFVQEIKIADNFTIFAEIITNDDNPITGEKDSGFYGIDRIFDKDMKEIEYISEPFYVIANEISKVSYNKYLESLSEGDN